MLAGQSLYRAGHRRRNGSVFLPIPLLRPRAWRFVQADTIVPSADTSQALNRYAYVKNNPLKFTDPSGHGWFSDIWKKIKSWIGTILTVALLFTGIGAFAASIIGNAVGAAVNGGTFKSFLIGAAIGMAAGMIAGAMGFSADIGPGFEFTTKNIIEATVAGAVTGAVSGAISSAVYGGNWGQNMLEGAAGGAIGAGVAMTTRAILNTPFMKPAVEILRGIGKEIYEAASMTIGTLKNLTVYTYKTITNAVQYVSGEFKTYFPTALNVAGKVWGSPNFVLGFTYGFAGVLLGGDWPVVQNGSLHFSNSPLIPKGSALSLGVGLYGEELVRPWGTYKPYPEYVAYESAHFPQSDVFGPLYLPSHVIDKTINALIGGDMGFNGGLLETGPYIKPPKPWWW